MREVAADDLDEMTENHDAPRLVDTRNADEFARGRVPGALHIAESSIQSAADPCDDRHETVLTRAFVLYSNHGVRSATAAMVLEHMGFGNVYSLAGGLEAWQRGHGGGKRLRRRPHVPGSPGREAHA